MNAKKIFLSTILIIGMVLLAIGFFVGTGTNFVSADDIKNKVENETYLDYIRSTATTEVVGDFTKYFIPDTKTVEIYDDKLKPMLNMTWLTDYEERVGVGTETEVACARIDYIDDKVLPVFNQIKSYDKRNNYEEINKDFTIKIKRPIVSESCYDEVINNETNESQEVCYEYDDVELIDIDSLIDVKYFPQEVCWYTDTKDGENIEFVIGNGDFWLVEFASFLVTDLVSYYKFDENAANTVVVDSHGSNTGTASTNTNNLFTADGILNSAFDFNGNDEGVSLGSALLPTSSADFSISAWIKADVFNRYIVSQYAAGQSGRMAFFINNDGTLSLFIDGGTQISSTTSMVTGTRYHVVVTRESGTVHLYIDASEAGGSGTNSASILNTATDISRAASSQFDGIIDEVGIWTRALTQEEITELYNSGDGLAYPFEAPVCTFSGFVKDEQGNAIEGANITVWNQFDIVESYENTTIAGGAWSVDIPNSTNTYMAGAYFNDTIIGQLKPYISGTC